MKIPEKGFYYHYKHTDDSVNNFAYEVVGVAKNTEDESLGVIYRPLYKSDWIKPANYNIRPLPMFTENVTKEGKTFPRFQKITDGKVIEKLEEIKREMYE